MDDKKFYPENYTNEVINIISKMSFDSKNVVIVGSMIRKSSLYSGDYDMIEEVSLKSVKDGVKGIQTIIKDLLKTKNTFIGDFKCGEIKDWKVFDDDEYNQAKAKEKVKALFEKGILTQSEYKKTISILVKNPSPAEKLNIQKSIRPELLRWKVKDILKGKLELRNGSFISLEQAIQTDALCKLDVVSFVDGSFTDFSILYIFKHKGKILNNVKIDAVKSLKNDILLNYYEGNYFKMAKRIYSFAKREKDMTLMEVLTSLFNSNLGNLYLIITNLSTLFFLLENDERVSKERIHYELEQTRKRLGNIYQIDKVNTLRVLEDILKLEQSESKEKLMKGIEKLVEKFSTILNKVTLFELRKLKLIPLPKKYI